MNLHIDLGLRRERIQTLMREQGIDALLISSNVNLLYLCGTVFGGIAYVPAEGEIIYLVRRPQSVILPGKTHIIRKIEQLPEFVDCTSHRTIALELDEQTYSEIERLRRLFPVAQISNATTLLRSVRMIKTPGEIEVIRAGAAKHVELYRKIPRLYRAGMTDIDLQIEIERAMRQAGSVGIFRTFGSAMEIYMGSLLVGDNAGTASAYDFALGGAGNPALPLGANGTAIAEGESIMVDMAGNFGVYLSDLTRTFSLGALPKEAYRLHDLSQRMHQEIMQAATPGTSCAELYNLCYAMAEQEGALSGFMGTQLQAQFVGHGLGLQINELPVLTPRSHDVLVEGMVIAFEPKFVLPQVGAVGIENTYLVVEDGVENLTPAPEEIIDLRSAD